ncbi:MAG: S8 family peptidase [Armatimonadetes bacterium]|nr:S8 family peptidase [Armatimonadota bacterium]
MARKKKPKKAPAPPRKQTPADTVSLIVALPDGADAAATERRCREKVKAKRSERLPLVNGFTVEVPRDEVPRFLEMLPPEAGARLDTPIRFPEPDGHVRRALEMAGDSRAPYVSRPAGMESVWEKGFNGAGVTVAVIDSGLHPHRDLTDRIVEFADMTHKRKKPYDPHGHGTHVAGVLAGDGQNVKGVAPGASVVGLRITDAKEAIQALDWVVENRERLGIRVVNMSLGEDPGTSFRADPWAQATQKAIDAGLVVVVAAGNECRGNRCPGTISTPGILPDAITVGAFDDHGTVELEDDTMYGRSSRGPTVPDKIMKPDLVAPGVSVIGPRAPGSALERSWPGWGDYLLIDGTSQATPMVAGMAAILLQANPGLTHQDIKEILKRSAEPLEGPGQDAQGAGRMDPERALKLARQWPKARKARRSSAREFLLANA